jgi:hypothetical protein
MKSHAIQTEKKVGTHKPILFKSLMEWHYACYLDSLLLKGIILRWEYEPTLFKFKVDKRNVVKAYLPDFKVVYRNGKVEYHETKGKMSQRNVTAFKLMAEQHPNVKLVLITYDSELYKQIRKEFSNGKPASVAAVKKKEINDIEYVAMAALLLLIFLIARC